jgi:anti-anti-sigma regulatory factor
MLRISRATTADDKQEVVLLRLEGQVIGRWVEELRRVCNETTGANAHGGQRVVLDLADVLFIDAEGIALFGELSGRRVSVTNCSLFVAEQLKGVANVNG